MSLIFKLIKVLFFYTCLASSLNFAIATVYIHTDNEQDMRSFSEHRAVSLSTDTNLLVLDNTSRKEIKFELVPLKRSLNFMQQQQDVCVTNKLKTKDRAKKYLFSKPVNLFFNRRLYQQSVHPSLNTNEQVDIKKLFELHPNRKLLVSSQMSYGDVLDNMIKSIAKQNLIIRNGGLQGRGILSMFSQSRADYVLLYPQELVDIGFELNASHYEIAGIMPYVTGHLMCANTPATKRFIKNVNHVIDSKVQNGELYQAHLKYIAKMNKDLFTQYFAQAFQLHQAEK